MSRAIVGKHCPVSVPLPGFSGLRPGIVSIRPILEAPEVSVPLPGFSGLRHRKSKSTDVESPGFSPVAGIQWVETTNQNQLKLFQLSFSPVAGIQWVETAS